MDEVQQAVQRLKQNGLKTTGVIFNGPDPTRKRYRRGSLATTAIVMSDVVVLADGIVSDDAK